MPTFSKRTKSGVPFVLPRRAFPAVARDRANIARCGRARPACAGAARGAVVGRGKRPHRFGARTASTRHMLDDRLFLTVEIQAPLPGATPIRCWMPAARFGGT